MALGISRLVLPEEFYDLTSAQLLVQPEPQYLHAAWCKAAMGGMDLSAPSAFGLPGRQIGGQGSPYAGHKDAMLELAMGLPTALFAVKEDFKGQPGTTMRFNRPQFTDSTYTEASRTLVSGATISTTPILAGSEQVSLTLKRYAGPYSSTVQPYAIEAFDAQMGVHNLAQFVGTHLRRDFDKSLDSFWVAIVDAAAAASAQITYPLGITTVDGPTAKGSAPLTYEQVVRTARVMDDASLPTLPDGKRVLLITSHGKAQLTQDPKFIQNSKNHESMSVLFPNYLKSLPDFHIFTSRRLTRTANTSSVDIHYGQAIAPGAFGCGVGRPASVRTNTNDNYGEQALAIWLADMALGCVDNRFCVSVRYAQDA